MTRRRNPQKRKETETVASTTELMDLDITKLSEIVFRVTMFKMMCRFETNINENINKRYRIYKGGNESESGRN